MLVAMQFVAVFCLLTSTLNLSNVDSSPVITLEPIQPRPPENICYNEALEEGGRKRVLGLIWKENCTDDL